MTLKVKDLIEELKKHDPEMIVICHGIGYCSTKISSLSIKEYVERADSPVVVGDIYDYKYCKGSINKKGGASRFEKKYGTNEPKPMLYIG